MPLSNLVVHAAVQAFAEALGVSGAAHSLAVGLWLRPPDPGAFEGFVGLGTGLAVVFATRARLFPLLADGARALGHPRAFAASPRAREALVLAWICAVSVMFGLVLRRAGAGAPPSPRAIAIGLGATGLAVAAGSYLSSLRADAAGPRSGGRAAGAGRPGFEPASFLGATLAGAAHAFGSWPGVSRVGVAAAVLLALGAKPARALELALLATVPFWWADAARALLDVSAFGKGQALLCLVIGFVGALAALALLRRLAARRALFALSLWMIPLCCAIFAYARVHRAPYGAELRAPAANDVISSNHP
jgi:undecaprenyl-diphosphatase